MTAARETARATAETAVAARGVYVYGVTSTASAREQPAAGIHEADVLPVRSDGLAALTSPLVNPDVRARRRELLAHSEVLASALERGAVLPLSFGTVFQSEEAVVRDFLVPRRDELRRLLRELEGRVELRVKAFYREEAILAEIVRENARIARLREAVRAAPQAATYGLRIDLGELVAADVGARSRRDAEAILERLRPLSLATEIDDEPIEHQVLRASFLVERNRVGAFDEAMDELAASQDGRIHFKYVGPLPPHSFVSLGPAERP
jgi:Gas vesicle synthesis protein GvpL/GvpF